MKIAKFGGSSMSHETQFRKVRSIVLADPARKVIVVSALGKRTADDDKVTDLLYLIYAYLQHQVDWTPLWQRVTERFIQVRDLLELDFSIEEQLAEIEYQLKQKKVTLDYLVSRGEYLTAQLMAVYLDYSFADASQLIFFDHEGEIDFQQTSQAVQQKYQETQAIVVPGFYGVNPAGKEKLLGRGGSDITGSILANVLQAESYENWTDVSGIMMADPRIIDSPKVIEEISFRELREMAYMGANVLHESAIFPVQEADIPIHIKNTNRPQDHGTKISNHEVEKENGLTGIAGRKDFLSITLFKRHMSDEIGFIWKAMSIFAKHGISIEHIPSGIDNIGVIVSAEAIADKLFLITKELKEKLGVEEIEVIEDLALISVVGGPHKELIGLSGKVLSILNQLEIRTSVLSQGAQELNLIIGVANDQYETVVKGIYEGMVKTCVAQTPNGLTSNS
ncbi:aspartate kinase [Enterococcus sp. 10A9_DIV0425]|uniref:Aspartokinase n=1 Tax=Candidatus Enterococcus wittei TaxID=1987383 RepID=A0A242K0V9_9ENTE|nr:aspartate kinase [Enterococcus sp. 10A9_DIV0425]OTP11297.1 aspartate kinase [Enterococcus sp. 10A9_DIV0425]THE11418.1 aspartate kinase [Enterococcus hirae]